MGKWIHIDGVSQTFFNFWKNHLQSFVKYAKDFEQTRRVYLLILISIIGIINLIPLGVIALLQKNSTLGFGDLVLALILILNLIHASGKKRFTVNMYVGIFFTAILFIYLFMTGGVNDSGFVWYFTFPLFASFLLGSTMGALASTLILVPVLLLNYLEPQLSISAQYSSDFLLRFIMAYLVVFAFSFLFERTREKIRDELSKVHDNLEERVRLRTEELEQVNRQLIQEIKDREAAEQEKQELHDRLVRLHKMEAIGKMAGEVAHDLNNILAGLVTYPEFLLLKIPPESPLRKAILNIKKSGEKAAAIVQDLLMMARSDVSSHEVLNINCILNDYFESLEYLELTKRFPGIRFQTDLGPDLMNIQGSPPHLSKIFMNLVTNSAESIVKDGTIKISTENRYVNKPIKGYDEINEGEYVVVEVADSGSGIPEEHLPKIFEPFYSQKSQGRSGSGLGLAVVWSSIKDHNGCVDVYSHAGKGTTFILFFPVTREKITSKQAEFSVKNFLGNGENILIVDDVAQQREIAISIFNELGYETVAVSSGSEALKYIKKNKVELVILDMIMKPGIDGLETFRRIKDLRPDQKAIIVSGFAETSGVQMALDMGAARFIKKPYQLETIARVVKDVLND